MEFLNQLDSSSLINLIGIGLIGLFVVNNQRKMKIDLMKMQRDGLKESSKSHSAGKDVLDKDKEFEKVGWLHENIRALKEKIDQKINGKKTRKQRYSLDFIPIMRFSALLKEHGEEAHDKLESLSDLAIHDENLQRELVVLDNWCTRFGIDLHSHSSQLFQFAVKRFKIAHPRIDSGIIPEKVLDECFSEFDKLNTLGGNRYAHDSEIVAKLSDNFVHSLLKRKLKPVEASVLLSLMPGSRVAIHLDMLPKKRLKSIVKNLSSMVKVLNPFTVRRVIEKIDSLYSPIFGGSRPTDIRGFFDDIVNHMSVENSKELIESLKREKLSQRVIPKQIHATPVALLMPSREQTPITAVSMNDFPIGSPNTAFDGDRHSNSSTSKSIFMQFAESSNPENMRIEPK